MNRPILIGISAIVAGIILTGCAATSPSTSAEDSAGDVVAVEQDSSAQEETNDADDASVVETVAYPEGWPAELPVPSCDLVSARTYGSGFPASGGIAALVFSCADGEAEGSALLDTIRGQYTATSDLGTSGFFENDTWQLQVGYDASEILYNVTAR
jgi:hypothetical protein|tara:strand:- start:134 stop:601 length:468 start_codon:yes stop_codon:yes gene_type:complete